MMKTVQFGPYEWIVLQQKKTEALLITKEVIACRPYHETLDKVTWENCDLRTWLNGKFLERFREEEQKKILTKKIQNPENPEFHTFGGNPTEDRVFLLSVEEAEKLFADDEERKCAPAMSARQEGIFVYPDTHTCYWWLRSPGNVDMDSKEKNNEDHFRSFDAARVNVFGQVFNVGTHVNYYDVGVRPAMWVRMRLKEEN